MTTWDETFDDRSRRPSLTIWLIGVSFAAFLIWAAFAWVNETVRGVGQVVPSSRPQIIQNLEGGILAELDVAEGDVVERGQTLARLYATQYRAQTDELLDQIAALDIRRLRLEAEMAGADSFEVPAEQGDRVPDIVASEMTLLSARIAEYNAALSGAKAVLKQAATERDLLEKMLKQDIAPLIEVTRARKVAEDAQAQHDAIVTKAGLDRAKEYSETQAELAMNRQKLKLSQDQLSRTTLVAPMRGVVNKLSVTTIGGVVKPGEEILQIIPLDDELFIEAKIKPRDIAQLREGQQATVKLSAYDYTIYGTLPAQVSFISADTFTEERARTADGDPHYKVTLRVDMSRLTDRQSTLEIKPGMQATVELETGGKTILDYLLKPLYKSTEAFAER